MRFSSTNWSSRRDGNHNFSCVQRSHFFSPRDFPFFIIKKSTKKKETLWMPHKMMNKNYVIARWQMILWHLQITCVDFSLFNTILAKISYRFITVINTAIHIFLFALLFIFLFNDSVYLGFQFVNRSLNIKWL